MLGYHLPGVGGPWCSLMLLLAIRGSGSPDQSASEGVERQTAKSVSSSLRPRCPILELESYFSSLIKISAPLMVMSVPPCSIFPGAENKALMFSLKSPHLLGSGVYARPPSPRLWRIGKEIYLVFFICL